MHRPDLLRHLDGPPGRLPTWLDRLAEAWASTTPRRRSLVILVVVCLLAIAVLRPRPHPWGPVGHVVTIARDLPPGRILAPADVRLEPWPDRLRPNGALERLDQALGQRLDREVTAGTPLTGPAIASQSPAHRAPPGWGTMAVSTDHLPHLEIGMVLDVHGGDGGMVTGAVVLDLADGNVWLALPRQQMTILARSVAWGQVHVVIWSDADRP